MTTHMNQQYISNPAAMPGQDYTAPLSDATTGRLEIAPGATGITLWGDPQLADLCRMRFSGEPPAIETGPGRVSLRYPRHSIVNWVKELVAGDETAAAIALNGALPWTIEIAGGVSRLTAELGTVQLDALRLGGGASEIRLTLPRPSGVVPVRIAGGASQVTITRPAGVAARLRVRGGATHLAFDDQRAGAIGGEVRWQSPDFAAATDRYEFEIAGGASHLTIATG